MEHWPFSHPAVNFCYFALMLGITMISMNPVTVLCSLFCSLCCAVFLCGKRAGKTALCSAFPMALLTAVLNPAFSHGGMTVLAELPSGNPLTMESILYGLSAGGMLAASLLWFFCLTQVVTSDQFVYLFGKISPKLALLLSMTLRFVPRFHEKFRELRQLQNDTHPIRNAVNCFSQVITWSLENAMDTADSMKSRGYGSGKRTVYATVRLSPIDRCALTVMGVCAAELLCCALAGKLKWNYFPSVRGTVSLLPLCTFALAGLLPCLLANKEIALWMQ